MDNTKHFRLGAIVWAAGVLAVWLVTMAPVAKAAPATDAAPASEPAPASDAAPSTEATAALDAEATEELALQTLNVFNNKCASCHSEQAKKPEKFAFILNLKKLANTPKYISPGHPDKSKLWQSIDDGDMPPEDAKTGQLSTAQKELIKRWIAAGAPENLFGPSAVGSTPEVSGPAASPASLPTMRRLFRFFGKLHPLLAHFPIALLVGAACAEFGWLWTRKPWLPGAIRFCTFFGAIGALMAGAVGWVDASFHTPDKVLEFHRWLGTIAALWALPTMLLSERGFRHRMLPAPEHDEPRRWFTIMIFVGIVLVGAAAHFGGTLVYTDTYWNW